MNRTKKLTNELLLYSGQYALFYIIMNFSKDGLGYFKEVGHTLLLFVLFFQTLFLTIYGDKALFRFLGSLIAPFIYTIVEYKFDIAFLLNTAHIFFWIFSIIVGLLQALQIKIINIRWRKINEYLITFINIAIFLFLYFYFDLGLTLKEQILANEIPADIYDEKLKINYLFENLVIFVKDPPHIYIIIGGIILGHSIAISRIKIMELSDKIKQLFGKYVDSSLRDKIITDGKGKSEKIEVAILFSDIRNFTKISEAYPPEKITQMLNIYFTEWANFANHYNGIIDKYIGDAVMIVFTGTDKDNASENAVMCGMKMLKKLEEIKLILVNNGLPKLEEIGVGIHFGDVIAGDIGSEHRVNYTYIGDAVNISSRLESFCKGVESNLIISETVYENISSKLKKKFFSDNKIINLKGKEQGIKLFYYEGKINN